MLVKNVFAYTVLIILLTTVIFIFIDDFSFKLKPVENEFKKEENNYNLPKALGIAFAITIVFMLIKENILISSDKTSTNNIAKNNSNNIIKKITNNKKINNKKINNKNINNKNISNKKNNNNNFNNINNNINRLLKKLKKN